MAYQSYAITYRPTDGITDGEIDALSSWISKVCDWHLVISEKTENERHLHAALYLHANTTRSNLHNRILSIKGIELSGVEKSVFRKGTKIMYNHDWALNYLSKGDSTVILSENLPEQAEFDEILGAYYPEKNDDRSSKKFTGDLWYLHLEKLWEEHADDPSTRKTEEEYVKAFLHNCMFVWRQINVISDTRIFNQKAVALTKFLNKELREAEFEPPEVVGVS